MIIIIIIIIRWNYEVCIGHLNEHYQTLLLVLLVFNTFVAILACENIRFSETSPATKSEEKRMFSQAIAILKNLTSMIKLLSLNISKRLGKDFCYLFLQCILTIITFLCVIADL